MIVINKVMHFILTNLITAIYICIDISCALFPVWSVETRVPDAKCLLGFSVGRDARHADENASRQKKKHRTTGGR